MVRVGTRCTALVVMLALASVALGGCNLLPKGSAPAPAAPVETPATTAGPAVGDMVAAKWTDGSFYLAKVTAAADGNVTVTYQDDNSIGTVPIADTKAIVSKDWAVGDKVLAVWASGRFYSGTVEAATPPTFKIKWDDGSAASDVDASKIVAP
jgi:hypothetical protein